MSVCVCVCRRDLVIVLKGIAVLSRTFHHEMRFLLLCHTSPFVSHLARRLVTEAGVATASVSGSPREQQYQARSKLFPLYSFVTAAVLLWVFACVLLFELASPPRF